MADDALPLSQGQHERERAQWYHRTRGGIFLRMQEIHHALSRKLTNRSVSSVLSWSSKMSYSTAYLACAPRRTSHKKRTIIPLPETYSSRPPPLLQQWRRTKNETIMYRLARSGHTQVLYLD